jgi:hypothetical protein
MTTTDWRAEWDSESWSDVVPAEDPYPSAAARIKAEGARQVVSRAHLERVAERVRAHELEKNQELARNLYLLEIEDAVKAIKGLRGRIVELARLAKSNGATWEALGDALGTSRQAACRSYGPASDL